MLQQLGEWRLAVERGPKPHAQLAKGMCLRATSAANAGGKLHACAGRLRTSVHAVGKFMRIHACMDTLLP
eukprot:359153-Chlamydomonas_euryale.AAC.2